MIRKLAAFPVTLLVAIAATGWLYLYNPALPGPKLRLALPIKQAGSLRARGDGAISGHFHALHGCSTFRCGIWMHLPKKYFRWAASVSPRRRYPLCWSREDQGTQGALR